jgi:hypothetical protein
MKHAPLHDIGASRPGRQARLDTPLGHADRAGHGARPGRAVVRRPGARATRCGRRRWRPGAPAHRGGCGAGSTRTGTAGGAAIRAAGPARHAVPARGVAAAAAHPLRPHAHLRPGGAGVGPGAVPRATGAAADATRWSIIVPCHRVLGADGSLTGYAGGLPRKTALLSTRPLLAMSPNAATRHRRTAAAGRAVGRVLPVHAHERRRIRPAALAFVRVAGASAAAVAAAGLARPGSAALRAALAAVAVVGSSIRPCPSCCYAWRRWC